MVRQRDVGPGWDVRQAADPPLKRQAIAAGPYVKEPHASATCHLHKPMARFISPDGLCCFHQPDKCTRKGPRLGRNRKLMSCAVIGEVTLLEASRSVSFSMGPALSL